MVGRRSATSKTWGAPNATSTPPVDSMITGGGGSRMGGRVSCTMTVWVMVVVFTPPVGVAAPLSLAVHLISAEGKGLPLASTCRGQKAGVL